MRMALITRRIARAATTALLLLVAIAWGVSHLTPVAYGGLGPISIGLGEGRAWIDRTGPWITPPGPGPGLYIGAEILSDGWIFKDGAGTWRVNRNAGHYSGALIWPVFLVLAAVTAFTWLARRVRPGFCSCGYDLRGMPSGSTIC